MDLNPTPEHQEILRKLEDTVWASDRAFFQASPRRRFRIRPSFDLETREQEIVLAASEPDLKPGMCWWTMVIALAPGIRMRIRFPWDHRAMPDPPPAVCRGVYKTLSRICPDLRRKVEEAHKALKDLHS